MGLSWHLRVLLPHMCECLSSLVCVSLPTRACECLYSLVWLLSPFTSRYDWQQLNRHFKSKYPHFYRNSVMYFIFSTKKKQAQWGKVGFVYLFSVVLMVTNKSLFSSVNCRMPCNLTTDHQAKVKILDQTNRSSIFEDKEGGSFSQYFMF